MAVKFIREKKKQKYLILVLSIVVLVTSVILWQGFFKKEKPVSPTPGLSFREIRINFDMLESPLLKELQPFEGIPSFVEERGRENPFLSY